MAIDIDVVDVNTTCDNGFLLRQRHLHPFAVPSNSVVNMVKGILFRAGKEQIRKLRIFGHGRSGQQGVGGGIQSRIVNLDQRLGVDPITGALWHRPILVQLCGRFTDDAIIELHGCHVGAGMMGEIFCLQLAQLWRVCVRAALSRQFADSRDRFEGRSVLEADWRSHSLNPIHYIRGGSLGQ
jgi:hypothetical protein